MTWPSRCVYWGKFLRTSKRQKHCSLVTFMRTHVDEFGDSIRFHMGWNSVPRPFRFGLSSPTTLLISPTWLHSTFVPGNNFQEKMVTNCVCWKRGQVHKCYQLLREDMNICHVVRFAAQARMREHFLCVGT